MALLLTPSSVSNAVTSVWVRVMPDVGRPFGSVPASANSMRLSAISPAKGGGTMLVSALAPRKSWFSTSIWLCTCSSEMFCTSLFQTMCTTTGMRTGPSNCSAPPADRKASVLFSIAARASR